MNYLRVYNGKKSASFKFMPIGDVGRFNLKISYTNTNRIGDVLYVLNTKTGKIKAYTRLLTTTPVFGANFDYNPRPNDEYCIVPKDHKIFNQ